MSGYRVQERAADRLEEIYRYTQGNWGVEQAERYVRGLFGRFEAISTRSFPWRPVPAEFGVDGFVCRYEKHLIYWRVLSDGSVGIVSILHERMHQIERFRDDFAP
jgi:toxin ParE1/3/4